MGEPLLLSFPSCKLSVWTHTTALITMVTVSVVEGCVCGEVITNQWRMSHSGFYHQLIKHLVLSHYYYSWSGEEEWKAQIDFLFFCTLLAPEKFSGASINYSSWRHGHRNRKWKCTSEFCAHAKKQSISSFLNCL